MNYQRPRRYFSYSGYILLIIAMCLPSVIITLYTYPVQDDFYNTVVILEEIAQGRGAFLAACTKAVKGYTTYSGYYFSLFLTYYTDAIVQCDIWGIRIIQCIMAIGFHVIVCIFVSCIAKEVMHFDTNRALQISACIIACITCMHYFTENEDLYWFCASVIYLIPTICILLGIVLLIYAINKDNKKLLIPVAVLGFLAGGAVLNVAAFGCILFVMTAYWGIVVKKKVVMSLAGSIPMLFGGIINVVAPGNFLRKGSAITGSEVYETLIGSFQYTFDRFKMFFSEHPIFPALLIIIFLLLMESECKEYKYKFWIPLVFTFVMILSIVIMIFPVALGYGMDIYAIMERSNFISDFAIFLFSFLCIFYWRGWLAVKFPQFRIGQNRKGVVNVLILCIMCIGILKSDVSEMAAVRQTRELLNGDIKEFSDWNVSVIQAMEQGEGEIVEIITSSPKDNCCLINPKFYYGEYDPEIEFANRSMAMFYGKKAIYIYNVDKE